MEPHDIIAKRSLSRRTFLRYSGLIGIGGVGALITACGGTSPTATTATQSSTTKAAAATSSSSSAASTTAASTTAASTSKATSAATSSAAGAGSASTTASSTSAASSSSASAAASPALPMPAKLAESPALADQVKAGKLPAVEKRVPKDALVIKPVESIGQYGGTWHAALVGGQDTAWLTRTMAYENLVRWDPEWKQVIPNVAQSFQANADATEFTFKLRQGMMWSDGQPFGVDDIVFYGEDVYGNSELTTSKGTNPFTVTKVDDLTFKVKFEKPNGLFLQNQATPSGADFTRFPAHYLKQFHKKYADPAKLDQAMKDNKADTWVKLFQLKGWGVPGTPYDALWSNPDLPTLFAWQITDPYGQGNVVNTKRNPFYWKVDTSGNQLPYLDNIRYDVLQDPQPLVLKTAGGEIDMQDRNVATNQNKPVLTDNQQKGNYHFFETVPSSMNTCSIAFNLNHKDPALKKVFQDKNFRIAMSYAINRPEVINTVFVGQGEPWQLAPRKETQYYNDQLAKQYTEYDVAKANQILDQAGYKKGADGMRTRTDGQKLSFTVEATAANTDQVDVMKLVVGYWKAVGVDAQLKPEDRSLMYTRKNANECDCVIWGGDGGSTDAILECRWYFPFSNESNYAEGWYTWYAKPSNPQAQPEEPPADTKKQMDLYDNVVQGSGDPAKQLDAFKQILQIAADQFYAIGVSLPSNGYGVVKNNFHNVPKSMPGSWLYPNPGPTNTCTYYISK